MNSRKSNFFSDTCFINGKVFKIRKVLTKTSHCPLRNPENSHEI